MKNLHLFFFLSILTLSLSSCHSKDKEQPIVVMLSMDGFRWDYPQMYQTPTLDSIAKTGVSCTSIPCFPSKTFPNHYAMATGLYPNHHGIVSNSFHTPTGTAYSVRDRDAVKNPAFYQGEPIWVTAEKQDIRSASLFWVGSETPIQNICPTYNPPYQHNLPFTQRIDTVIHWLSFPSSQRPRLILWYLHEPDATGHRYGPHHHNTKNLIRHLDSLVAQFTTRLNKLACAHNVNLIITSDHGMGAIDTSRYIQLNQIIADSLILTIDGNNPFFLIEPRPQYTETVYSLLKNRPHLKVWHKNDVPLHFHYGAHPNISSLVAVADSSWSMGIGKPTRYFGGTHGYDNRNSDMHAIFYACGPAFKQNHHHPAINNIDLYPLIAHILALNPAQTDGTLNHVQGMLK